MVTPQSGLDYSQIASSLPQKDLEPEDFESNFGRGFLGGREKQRNLLLWFALGMSSLSLLILFFIVVWQALLRIKISPDFEIISERSLEILAVAIFGQVFGVVYIIAKAVWSNDEFKLINKK